MEYSMTQTFNNLKSNTLVANDESNHLFNEGFLPFAIIRDYCKIYDHFQDAANTNEPFMSVIDKIGCFDKNETLGSLSLKKYYDPRHGLITRQLALHLGKKLLTGENAPSHEEYTSLFRESLMVAGATDTHASFRSDLFTIASFDKDVSMVALTLNNPLNVAAEPEFVETITEDLSEVVDTMTPYIEKANETIQSLSQEEERMKADLVKAETTLIDGFNSFIPQNEDFVQ